MPFISNNNTNPLLLMTSSQPQHHLLPHCKSSSGSSRWNPTPEQITMLEEVYKSGTRTPTTQQIQEIAIKLRKYGKIEGKNVFYWFQNHKARERQKRRRPHGDHDHDHTLTLPQHLNLSSSGGHRRLDHTKICPSFPQQQQMELSNKDNNEDHGTTKESGTRSEDGKDATWLNLINPINTEDCDLIITSLEEKREIRTLDLFPVKENQEKTGGLGLIEEAKQAGCNYCYYYEFIPLKK